MMQSTDEVYEKEIKFLKEQLKKEKERAEFYKKNFEIYDARMKKEQTKKNKGVIIGQVCVIS